MDLLKGLFKKNNVNAELSDAYKRLFSSPEGKKVLDDLLRFTRVDSPSFVPQQPDLTAYNEGLRRVGIRILSMMEGTPNKETKNLTNNEF